MVKSCSDEVIIVKQAINSYISIISACHTIADLINSSYRREN